MSKYEDILKQGVCSDAGRVLLPAVPGLAVGALTSWSGPGAIAAGSVAGMATSAAQQEYCDGKVDAIKTAVGGVSGGVGTGVVLAGKAAVLATGAMLGQKPDLLQQAMRGLERVAANGDMVGIPLALTLFAAGVDPLSKGLKSLAREAENFSDPEDALRIAKSIVVQAGEIPLTDQSFKTYEHMASVHQRQAADKTLSEAERFTNELFARAATEGLQILHARQAAGASVEGDRKPR